jgi:predicted membrane protein
MNLGRVEVNIGAGEVTMDLRGEPKSDYSVQIRGGVGETTVYLPRNAAIAARATKGLGEIDTEGLAERDGMWTNPDATNGAVTVRLDVKGGIGEIRLVR